ncbi:hypothetical protein Syun_006789 [Stephania yunnanensis]|uniref:Uncharacterized protein n=1 Tax=Stephania yunnanensis TaxID=152371 RepID=A0AAP0PXZ4_9MAGN
MLSGAKPRGNSVEARDDLDVQIVRRLGYRGERLIEPSSRLVPSSFPRDRLEFGCEFYRVKPMIRGIGDATSSTYSQTLNRPKRGKVPCERHLHMGTRRLTATLGSRRRRRGPREELSFTFNDLPTTETWLGGGRVRRAGRAPHVGGVRCAPAALENPEDRVSFAPVVLITASGLQVNDLGRWKNVGKGSRQNGSVTREKDWLEGWARGPSPNPSAGFAGCSSCSAARAGHRVLSGTDLERLFRGPSSGVERSTRASTDKGIRLFN